MKTYGAVDLAGLTGATQATRWVGGTTTGAPTTGTFAVGDYVVARDGAMFICTSAGSPGTWLDMSSGRELGYAEITSTVTTTVTSTATQVDAAGLIITVTVGTRPIMLEFWALVWNATAGKNVVVTLVEAAAGDANRTPVVGQGQSCSGTANGFHILSIRKRLAPSAGSHTYKVQFLGNTGAGQSNLGAGADFPAFIAAHNA